MFLLVSPDLVGGPPHRLLQLGQLGVATAAPVAPHRPDFKACMKGKKEGGICDINCELGCPSAHDRKCHSCMQASQSPTTESAFSSRKGKGRPLCTAYISCWSLWQFWLFPIQASSLHYPTLTNTRVHCSKSNCMIERERKEGYVRSGVLRSEEERGLRFPLHSPSGLKVEREGGGEKFVRR